MKTVAVNVSHPYSVEIGEGLLPRLGAFCPGAGAKAAIVSDSSVWPLYGKSLEDSLRAAGWDSFHFVFPAGESSKNGNTFLSLLNFLAENRLTRGDCIFALGGGVVGDLAGFAAAVYLRGIPFVQLPTTLLGAVDSSVGGKTAIDLPTGKNLAGAFYQPARVLCDTNTLDTLPPDIFRDGCAEVIKYAVLFDPELFSLLLRYGPNFPREAVIARCVALKAMVVEQDEFDTGLRMKLNLGHTIGHAIEKCSRYAVSHGRAVAMGMAAAARAAAAQNFCAGETRDAVLEILNRFDLPTTTNFSAGDLFQAALSDKKRAGGTVNLILPEKIGSCAIVPTPVEALQDFIKAGL